jgi:FixJ family two-component response regulator
MPDKAVFVVDDDAAVRQGLRFMLRAAGYGVEAFPSARSFLEDYDPRRGGCLLLDVRMPQMTGLELQQQLNVRGWRIPVIFITGHCTVSLAIAAMKAGAFDFIEKPLREDHLLESIERALHWNERTYEERLERVTLQVRVALLTPRERHRPASWHQFSHRRAASRPNYRKATSAKSLGSDPYGDNNECQSDHLIQCLGLGRLILALSQENLQSRRLFPAPPKNPF